MRNFFGLGGDGRGKASVTFTDNTVDGTNLTTYTFSSQSLGADAPTRKIIVGVVGVESLTGGVSSLTVAGVSASVVIAGANSDVHAEIWIADVPTGTTGDIVVTFSTAKDRAGIGVFRAVGLRSPASATASSVADPMSASLFIPSDGIAIGVAADANTNTNVWSNLAERYDDIIEADSNQTGASLNNEAVQTPTITCDPSAAALAPIMVLASWGPD